jgi:hypothetical protein
MEFDDLISENITRDAAEKLLTLMDVGSPEGAVERILNIDIDSLTPPRGDNWISIIPGLGMQKEQIQAIIEGG